MKSVNIAVDGKYAEESAQEMIEDLREVLEKLGITVEITEGSVALNHWTRSLKHSALIL